THARVVAREVGGVVGGEPSDALAHELAGAFRCHRLQRWQYHRPGLDADRQIGRADAALGDLSEVWSCDKIQDLRGRSELADEALEFARAASIRNRAAENRRKFPRIRSEVRRWFRPKAGVRRDPTRPRI